MNFSFLSVSGEKEDLIIHCTPVSAAIQRQMMQAGAD